MDDALPTGAVTGTDGSDRWMFLGPSPNAYSGAVSHQSNLAAGEHQHFFDSATQTLPVNTGDKLYAYVYLEPGKVPSEIMLEWNDGSWEHRAYWGPGQDESTNWELTLPISPERPKSSTKQPNEPTP